MPFCAIWAWFSASETGMISSKSFTATLLPGQRVTVSVPRARGERPMAFELGRVGDRVEVRDTPAVTGNY